MRSERRHTTQPPPVAAPQTASTATTADARSLGSASTDGSTVTEERVNFARWRHVDDDTAARFIEALDAMDGATEPLESDSGMNVKSIDSDKDVTSGSHARSKRLELSVPDTLGQRYVTQSDLGAYSVTITISRKAAEKVADWPDDERYPFSAELGKAARAALEEER